MNATAADLDVAAAVLRLHEGRWIGDRLRCVSCHQPYPCETVRVVEIAVTQ